jgi:ribosome-binding ATPase YchF (GTP1/OBG family)
VAEFMERNGGTGVQRLIDKVYLEVLRYVPVFPVEDPNTLTDSKGNVLPDVYLVKEGFTPRDLAFKIHTDLGRGFLYAFFFISSSLAILNSSSLPLSYSG